MLDLERAYQITVHEPGFDTPRWLKGAVVYQIFPDRFRNGDHQNDTRPKDSWIYGREPRYSSWKDPICDARGVLCPLDASSQFYGGDLAGIREKLDYLKELGVTVIYLNPIFRSPSYHRYDTQDFFEVDTMLGDKESFTKLVTEARARGMRLLLDGAFANVSADSPYFDYYSRWNTEGELAHPEGPGLNDGSGACEAVNSPYRTWFSFKPDPLLATKYPDAPACPHRTNSAGTLATRTHSYNAWFMFAHLPRLDPTVQGVRDLFFAKGERSVGPYWIKAGAAGWRLDTGGTIDPGRINEPKNLFWSGLRQAVRAVDPEAVLIGEEWGDASTWLLGGEWDTTMNYRFQAAALNWMFDGCQGLGCKTNGLEFSDNDNNDESHSGAISALTESRFALRLQGIREAYPRAAWMSALNLLDTHDTNRILFMLKKISKDDAALAMRKLRLLALFQYTYPGAPMVYYGGEAGLTADGDWDGGRWQDDPQNRTTFPWEEEGGAPDRELTALYRKLGHLRTEQSSLRTGDYETVLTDDARRLFGFRRWEANEEIVVLLNRSPYSQTVDLVQDLRGTVGRGADFKDIWEGRASFDPDADGGALVTLPPFEGIVLRRTR